MKSKFYRRHVWPDFRESNHDVIRADLNERISKFEAIKAHIGKREPLVV